jgi:hypothetical protein
MGTQLMCLPNWIKMVGSLWWHMLINPTTRQRQNTTCMRGNASLLFGQFILSNVISMMAHLFWLLILSP